MPAEAGIQNWIPAFAGKTVGDSRHAAKRASSGFPATSGFPLSRE